MGGLTNAEIAAALADWNSGDLSSFLVEISAAIFAKPDDRGEGDLIDKILDKTGMKGTGKWTVQQAADLSVAAPTIEASLDARFLSGIKEERVAAAAFFEARGVAAPVPARGVDKAALVARVRSALYASKICSYAQGMNIIRAKSEAMGWDIDLGALARIWKGGCIIRAAFLDDIRAAYARDPSLPSLLIDPMFGDALAARAGDWRAVVSDAVLAGVAVPGMTASLSYFDTYRRARLPANLVQAQRDFFGSHTYERVDGQEGWFHTLWSAGNSADSITTSGYTK